MGWGRDRQRCRVRNEVPHSRERLPRRNRRGSYTSANGAPVYWLSFHSQRLPVSRAGEEKRCGNDRGADGERVMEQCLPSNSTEIDGFAAGNGWYHPCELPIESLDDAGGEG